MKIKIIPETEAEKRAVKTVEHTGVNNFFIFGNKKDKEGDLIDFHDWTGSYRYLEGSLYHFLTTITEEKKSKMARDRMGGELTLRPPIQAQPKPQMIKRGEIEDSKPQIINVEELNKVPENWNFTSPDDPRVIPAKNTIPSASPSAANMEKIMEWRTEQDNQNQPPLQFVNPEPIQDDPPESPTAEDIELEAEEKEKD
jgi:hypothetical protein